MDPMAVPQIQGLRAMLWIWRFFRDPVGTIEAAYERFGNALVLGPLLPGGFKKRKYILALGAEFNRIVFGDPSAFRTTGQTQSGPADSALRRLRQGLTAMNGPKHRQQRSFIAPFFSRKAIDQYCRNLVQTADDLLSAWPVGQIVNIAELYHHLMLRLSARALFARENSDRLDKLGALVHEMLKRNLSPWVQLLPFDIPGTPYYGLMRHGERLEQLLMEIIGERRARPQPHGGDLFDHLIHARDAGQSSLTDADLMGQATILFGASYETQSKAMTWTSLLLAQHPRIQHRLLTELDTQLRGRTPTLKQLERLPYLEAVLNESMRLLPPVPYTLRRSTVDMDMLGIPVQRGDWIVLSHFITHRCPTLYPQPRRFQPERWSFINPNQYEFIPFIAGPRWCIGKPLAMTMMKLVLAMVMQRFRLQVPAGARIDRVVRVTMSPKTGVPMILAPQDGRFQARPLAGTVADMVDWIDTPAQALARAA
jgi:cytochrome P450